MRFLSSLAFCLGFVSAVSGATFGTVVPITGGAADFVIDEPRGRLYLTNTNSDRVEVYSIAQRRFLTPIRVESQPLGIAMSRNGATVYVACHNGSSLIEIDAEALAVRSRVSLPARPEGVAVGFDERVLITTVGTGQNNLFNVLLVYTPNAGPGEQALSAVPVAPPAPANPLLPPNNFGRGGLISRSFLDSSRDGRFIIGMNVPNAQARAVFVYEVASGTVLRSRTIAGVSSVLSVAPDGTKFMAGLTLFDTETLTILAQQNAANAPYPFPQGTNFNLQQNQGGSVFTPDGGRIYSAFNFVPVQNPPARPNVSQLMISDPDNLLIETGIQLNENIAGKIDITTDGATIYALSESGFLIIPVSQLRDNPIAEVETAAKLLTNDQCGVFADQRTGVIAVRNGGRGRITAQAQLLQTAPAGPGGLGGIGGPGAGLPGGGAIIIIPPIPLPGGGAGGGVGGGGAVGGGAAAGGNNAQNAVLTTAPRSRTIPTPEGVNFEFSFNPINRSLGTISPTHTYTIQSNEAVNIPNAVRIYQNNRNTESRGDIVAIDSGLSANEGLLDILHDQARQRVYIANSGKNRIEVFDTRSKTLLAPIKVGQLPHSMALSPDGFYLYVANSGAETISVVDLDSRETVGRIRFPATPFNNNAPLVRPELIASGLRGPLVLMSDGTLWRIVGNQAVPRTFNTGVIPVTQGRQIIAGPARTMASSPGGETIMVLANNGFAYLYDANQDDFVASRQVVAAPITGYYGPVAVGPRGQYYLVNGFVLNAALTQIGTAGTTAAPGPVRPGQAPVTVTRPVASVSPVGATTFARWVQPVIAQGAANVVQGLTDAGNIEIVDVTNARVMALAPTLERPLSTPTGNQRANVAGRSMAVDPAGNTAYVLTTSGLSVVPLDAVPVQTRPAVNQNGIVNVANLQPSIAPGSLISINGRNLGSSAQMQAPPYPTTLGGACVTINDRPIPLLLSSTGQINAQIPTDLAAGRYTVVVRNTEQRLAANPSPVTLTKYAPAVMMEPDTKRALIFHADGNRPVTKDDPAKRDRPLLMYAIGLGVTKGPRIVAGEPVPATPEAVTDRAEVFFGDPRMAQSAVIVDWSGLVPGFAGLYQLQLRVPGFHGRGDALPVSIRIGGVSSPITGTNVPLVAVD